MALGASGAPAGAECRQALALGLDVSGSVDAAEFRLQLDGLAGALTSRPVKEAILSPDGTSVALAAFLWSGREAQRLILGWTEIRDAAGLDAVAARLSAWRERPDAPTTALGSAMAYGAALLDRAPACWGRTLDLSGDGESNDGPRPMRVRDRLPAGLIVNALVVVDDATANRLPGYFRAEVIHGPGAFVELASGFADYQRAMERKLVRELAARVLGRPAEPSGPALGDAPVRWQEGRSHAAPFREKDVVGPAGRGGCHGLGPDAGSGKAGVQRLGQEPHLGARSDQKDVDLPGQREKRRLVGKAAPVQNLGPADDPCAVVALAADAEIPRPVGVDGKAVAVVHLADAHEEPFVTATAAGREAPMPR